MAAQQAINTCINFAESSADVRGLVLLGSFAVDQSCSTSDVDLLFILMPDTNISIYQNDLCTLFKNIVSENNGSNTSGIHMYQCDIRSTDKTAIYLVHGDKEILKVDCGHATNVIDKVKYIVGSEIKPHHLSKVVLLDYTDNCEEEEEEKEKQCEKEEEEKAEEWSAILNKSPHNCNMASVGSQKEKQRNGHIYQQLETILASANPYSASGLRDADPLFHLHNFVENFDNCCKNFDNGDIYRTQFHIFLLRHRIFCLLWLSWGYREHAYLPKMLHQELEAKGIRKEVWKGLGNEGNVMEELAQLLVMFEDLKLMREEERRGQKGEETAREEVGVGGIMSVDYENDLKKWREFLRFRLKRSWLMNRRSEEEFYVMYDRVRQMAALAP